MRIRHLVLLLLPHCALPLSAQPSSDDLYFPPEISVGVSQEFEVEMRLTHQVSQKDVRDRLKFTNHLTGTRRIRIHTEQLLPIIYFDPASYVIPGSYRQLRGNAVLEYREGESMYQREGYRPTNSHGDILNIIGSRMRSNSEFRIGLQGTWSREPGEDESVARERIEVVAEYLQNVWGIDPERIVRLEPESRVDSNDHVLRQQEARSVRIVPNRGDLLAPVTYETTSIVRGAFLSLKLRVIPRIPIEEVRSARLRFMLNDEIIQETDLLHPEIYDDHSITWYVGWNLPESVDPSISSLDIEVLVEDINGKIRASEVHAIPIRWVEERWSERSYNTLRYEYRATPFNAGDSILSQGADRPLVEWLGAVASELQEIRDRIEWIEVIGSGDITEVEGIDPVTLATALAIRELQSEPVSQVRNATDLPVVYSIDVPRRENGSADMDQLEERAQRARSSGAPSNELSAATSGSVSS